MLLLLLVRLLRLTLARILKLNFLGRITRSPDGRACACSPTAHTRSPPFAPTRTQPRNLAEPPLARSLARFPRSATLPPRLHPPVPEPSSVGRFAFGRRALTALLLRSGLSLKLQLFLSFGCTSSASAVARSSRAAIWDRLGALAPHHQMQLTAPSLSLCLSLSGHPRLLLIPSTHTHHRTHVCSTPLLPLLDCLFFFIAPSLPPPPPPRCLPTTLFRPPSLVGCSCPRLPPSHPLCLAASLPRRLLKRRADVHRGLQLRQFRAAWTPSSCVS